MVPSTLLSWQFLVPAGAAAGPGLGAPHGSCGKSQTGSYKPQGRGRQENCFSTPKPSPQATECTMFTRNKVFRKDNQSKLLFLVPLGSRVCWIRTWAQSKPAFEMVFYTISGVYLTQCLEEIKVSV